MKSWFRRFVKSAGPQPEEEPAGESEAVPSGTDSAADDPADDSETELAGLVDRTIAHFDYCQSYRIEAGSEKEQLLRKLIEKKTIDEMLLGTLRWQAKSRHPRPVS